ncbi:hypothetical protein GGR54DRAFT_637779 [Hypoxylon sp. NC1633]|nr:hypothetical protein GGR54DRAFT_637779 [Hypoxylon sp. NC1633]
MGARAKRKTSSPYGAQGWTSKFDYRMRYPMIITPSRIDNYPSPQIQGTLSDDCHSKLISIAKAMHAANEQYLRVVEEYMRWRNRSSSWYSSSPNQKSWRFDSGDLSNIKHVVQDALPVDRSAVPQLLQGLGDYSYIDIWKRSAENMAYLRNHPKHLTSKHQGNGKKRAIELKNCRVTAETCFRLVETELRFLGHGDVCEGIFLKIDMLRKYEDAYPIPSEKEPPFRFQVQTPILIFVTLVYIFASLIPMGIAFSRSPSEAGTTEDADFYLLIQNTMIQVLGLVTAVGTVYRRSHENAIAWICALSLTAIGIICAVVSVPLYLCKPTFWSAFTSFSASATQAGVTLEIALMTENPKAKQP